MPPEETKKLFEKGLGRYQAAIALEPVDRCDQIFFQFLTNSSHKLFVVIMKNCSTSWRRRYSHG